MHLADTDASADRRPGQLVEEAEPDDPLVPIAQRVDELVDHDSRLETHRWSMTPLSAAELAGEIALVACATGLMPSVTCSSREHVDASNGPAGAF